MPRTLKDKEIRTARFARSTRAAMRRRDMNVRLRGDCREYVDYLGIDRDAAFWKAHKWTPEDVRELVDANSHDHGMVYHPDYGWLTPSQADKVMCGFDPYTSLDSSLESEGYQPVRSNVIPMHAPRPTNVVATTEPARTMRMIGRDEYRSRMYDHSLGYRRPAIG